MTYRAPIRDLAELIGKVAREHPAYGQATLIVQNCCDHLCAMAAVEEQRAPSSLMTGKNEAR